MASNARSLRKGVTVNKSSRSTAGQVTEHPFLLDTDRKTAPVGRGTAAEDVGHLGPTGVHDDRRSIMPSKRSALSLTFCSASRATCR